MNFTGNMVNPSITGPSLIPQQQIVVPPITIPQGFTPKYSPQTVVQLTARGKEAAKNIPLGPNSKVAIFEEDPEQSVFYFRETDAYSNDICFSTNSYEEVADPPAPEYLTKQEFYSAIEDLFRKLKEENNSESVCEKNS